MAMEENRDVFAIPGSIHAPQSRGCHELIRHGAILVESTMDIRTALSGWIDPGSSTDMTIAHPQSDLFIAQPSPDESTTKPIRKRAKSEHSYKTENASTMRSTPIVKAAVLPEDHPQYALYNLLIEPQSINQLVEILQQSASDITTDLMILEIEGVITSEQGFYQQKKG